MDSSAKRRLRVAQEAARIMLEEGVEEHLVAKRKAAERLGFLSKSDLPRNDDIDVALRQHIQIYHTATQGPHLSHLRHVALEIMQMLEDFSPRLVGPVVDGSAGRFSPVTLHAFPDSPEELLRRLINLDIPFRETEQAVNGPPERITNCPGVTFYADEVRIDITILPPRYRRTGLGRRKGPPAQASIEDLHELTQPISRKTGFF